jgi:hypothetical protein
MDSDYSRRRRVPSHDLVAVALACVTPTLESSVTGIIHRTTEHTEYTEKIQKTKNSMSFYKPRGCNSKFNCEFDFCVFRVFRGE